MQTGGATPAPPVVCGFNGGDPHLVTLDGLAYDCHGRGEFFLTKVESTQGEVQVRFEPWSQDPSGPFTVTTAMVAREEGSSVVQVTLAASGSALEILVDGETYDEAANPGTGVMLDVTSSQVDMLFLSCMEISVSFANAMLSVEVNVPRPLETTGLLGNNNGDPVDDWMVCLGIDQCVFDFVFAGEAVGMATLAGLRACGVPACVVHDRNGRNARKCALHTSANKVSEV
ncbi:conserved unknown protein [Ectocarpus siliculosus]|uniref:VWFD domain-containing protein n=1 Tax=Ectocarpus siliculosus TaxID=2880 RepID=D7G5U3_ECTSI|nr:conserved unknown protein [Ectocarpus siliculosus]|eukprot:CBJ27390.1 conserved unknown protein [Ectocarpus siliculosus]